MTPDRLEIAKLVLEGKLSQDHITLEEAQELHSLVMDAVVAKMSETNSFAFVGADNDTIH